MKSATTLNKIYNALEATGITTVNAFSNFLDVKDITEPFRDFAHALEVQKSHSTIYQAEEDLKNNMIMYKKTGKMGNPQIKSTSNRYCSGKFTFGQKKILLVSFHGNNQLDERDKQLKVDER